MGMSDQLYNIPDELQEREQWLYWNSSADKPRKPLASPEANHGASWSDPDEWVGFGDAVGDVEKVETAGIGYVTAADNDDYEDGRYGVIDLDGCADENGRPKKWLPSLQPFFDHGAYIEHSPSFDNPGDSGLHIPVKDPDVPDWWTDQHFTDDEHEGVEVLTNKFSTFTGNRVDGSGEDVVEYGEWIDEWLAQAYKVITGEDPLECRDDEAPTASSAGRPGECAEWMGEDLAEEALDAIDPDTAYPTWMDIGFALVNHFGRTRGGAMFKDWSRGGTKWDRDAERQAERIIDDAGDYDYGIATLVYHAKNSGWDVPSISPPSTDGSEVIDPDEQRELPTPQTLSVKDGGYGFWKHREGEADEWRAVTNFQLETNSFATDPDDPTQKQVDMTVHPAVGESYDVVVSPTVFNEKREFKSNVVIGLTTTFSGSEDVLNNLKTFVGTQDAPVRTGTYQMGRFGDEWVTPEGVLTADGWTDDPEHIHVSRDIGAERKWNLTPDDGDEYDAAEVRRILELLPKTRDVNRFIPVIGWFYATPFKPLIHEWTGQFNLLGVLGETGAGKSASLSVMWELFGMGGDPMTADDTKYVLLTTLASTNAIPMWFDEYKPSDMRDWAVDTFWNEIRKTTRGGVSARGNPDGSTTEYHLTAPAVVSGEERVHGSAEERRGIYTTFKKAPTESGSEHARAFANLVGGSSKTNGDREYFEGYDLSGHALAYYQWALARDDDEVREIWRESAKHVSQLLADHDIDGLEELVEQGLQTIKFGATLYRAFTDEMGGDADIITPEQIDDAIMYVATNAIGGANRKSHLDVLLEVAARAASHGYLEEGEHYAFIREGQADEELRLNLATGFDMITRYANDHSVAEDLLNSKDDYYERIKDSLDESGGYVSRYSIPTEGIGRCVGIYVQDAIESIDGFEKGMFGDYEDEDAEAVEAAQVPLGDIDPGYQTVTVECVSKVSDVPDMFTEMGVLRDATGTVDYVIWDRAEPVDLEEGGTYRIVDAKVGTDPDGATQIELDGRITDVEEIGAGVGYLSLDDPGSNERLDAASDGGKESEYGQAKPQMKDLLEEHGPCSKGEWMAKAMQNGINQAAAEGAVESLKRQGEVMEMNDEFEVT